MFSPCPPGFSFGSLISGPWYQNIQIKDWPQGVNTCEHVALRWTGVQAEYSHHCSKYKLQTDQDKTVTKDE